MEFIEDEIIEIVKMPRKHKAYDIEMPKDVPSYIANSMVVHNSGQSADYVLRHNKKKKWDYDHELLKPITEDTYGLILYQEQVMKVMFDLGKFSWATAESARKIMSKSAGKDAFNKMRKEFCENANKFHNLKIEEAGKIFDVVSTFGCLTGDTEIYRVSANQYKGMKMSIEEAFAYQSSDNFKHRKLKILSMCNDDRVRYNTINKIIKTGKKEVFLIKTDSNKMIKASKEHRFLINGEWKTIADTVIGDLIQTTDLQLPKKIYGCGIGSGPFGQKSPIFKKGKNFQVDKKLQKEKLKIKYNGMCQICGSDKFCEMHHINHNHKNNSDKNTMWLCRKCHKQIDKDVSFKRFQQGYCTYREKIIEIKSIGERETFDIEMIDEPRNFIANGFISHNSYGFNLAHAVEYSIISYWCAWLKTYYPAEFFASLLSREGDENKTSYYIKEAREFAGIKVLTPHINYSQIGFSFYENNIITGLDSIKGIGEKSAKKIIKLQPFKDFKDFVIRAKPSINIFKSLICCGVFDDFYKNRKYLYNNAEILQKIKAKDDLIMPIPEVEGWTNLEKQNMISKYLSLPSDLTMSEMIEDPFENKIKYEEIGSLEFNEIISERWIKGIVTFINFKQEGLEGQWTMFDNVLERRYAHLNVSDGTGNVLVHLAPEQYTYYKKYLERGTGFPVIIKAHSIKNYQKLYCDAIIVLNDIDWENPIINYINKKCDKIIEAAKIKYPQYKVGIIKDVTYKVSKNKKPYARLSISGEEGKWIMCFRLTSDIFIAGEVIVYSLKDAFIDIKKRYKKEEDLNE